MQAGIVARGLYSAYTLLQALHENITGQIDTDEYHFAHSLLILVPRLTQIAAHELVHALKNHFALGAAHVQHAFVAQHLGAIDVDDGTQKVFQFGRIKGAVRLEDEAFDKDGNKEEPFKKAVKDAEKKVAEDFGTTAAVVGGAALGAKLGKTVGIYRDAKGMEKAGLAKPRTGMERLKGAWKGTAHPEYDDDVEAHKINPKYQFEDNVEEGSTGDYSAKKARAGKDIGKPGKAFAKIAKSAGERYGSKERGEKVAGAVLAKLRGKRESIEQEGNAFGKAVRAAKADGIQPGEKVNVGGKEYPVKETGMTPKQKKFAALAPPRDKATQKDRLVGAGVLKPHPTNPNTYRKRSTNKK